MRLTRWTALVAAILALGVPSLAAPMVFAPQATDGRGIGVVIDRASYEAVEAELADWVSAVAEEGYSPWVLVDEWDDPLQVREAVVELYRDPDSHLEGLFLLGDIPIAMLRDAQHLTSAFKMDQVNFERFRSSVPTDRVYDDLDMELEYWEPDPDHRLLHYMRLEPDSPTYIERELYSGRATPRGGTPEERHAALAAYLERATEAHESPEILDRVLFAAGHGYIHESLNAYQADVALAGEQLTYGSGAAVRVDAIGQLYDNYVKPRLFRQWVDPELDLLFVRSHGSPDIIHMDPPMPSEGDEADDDPDEPESPYDPEDVSAPEVRELPDGAEMVFLDCCFNGSFAHDEYVAEALLFDVGECVAVYANSRNVRQDIWSTENLGMIRAGYSAGEVHKRVRYLESHLLGDPTFAFAPASTSTELRRALETSSKDTLLSLAERAQDSAARGVALERYAQLAGREALPVVTRALSDDPATFVRLKALAATVALAPSNLAELVTGRIDDPDPTVRKFAVILASDIGDPASADALIAASAADACMRVRWQAAQGLNRLGRAQSAISDDAIADVLECAGLNEQAEMYREAATRTRDEGGLEKWCIERMGDDDPEKRRMGVRTLRGNRYQDALPILLELLQSDDDAVVRETAAEALGWWSLSHRKPEIRAALEAVLAQPDLPASVRDAALVSLRRLDDGLNVPLVP